MKPENVRRGIHTINNYRTVTVESVNRFWRPTGDLVCGAVVLQETRGTLIEPMDLHAFAQAAKRRRAQ